MRTRVRLKLALLVLGLASVCHAIPPDVLAQLGKFGFNVDEVKCRPYGPGSAIELAVGEHYRTNRLGIIYECICGDWNGCKPLNQTVDEVRKCCQTEGGKCIKPGKNWYEEKSCDNLACVHKKNKSKPQKELVKKGCTLKGGKCLRHGQSGREGCDDVKCKNGKLIVTMAGCTKSDGKCAETGKSWHDTKTCDYVRCQRAGQVAKIKVVKKGCYGNDGKCIRSKEKVTVDCTTKKCQNGEFTITKAGCKKADGTCIAKGEKWSDSGSCDEKKCVVKNKEATIEVLKSGCDDGNGKCLKSGDKAPPKDCNERKCKKGKLVLTKPGCKKPDGQCAKTGESWTDENCEVFRCKKMGDDGAQIKDMGKGCRSPDGKCVKHKEKHTDEAACMTSRCENGQLKPAKRGCPKPDGGCYAEGKVIQKEKSCSKLRCRDGKLEMAVAGCKKPDGSCVKVGDQWTDAESCEKMECKRVSEAETAIKKVGAGCKQDDGSCVPAGHTWFDQKSCNEYKCKKQSNDVSIRVVVGQGCRNEKDKCIKHGEEALAGCSTHKCVNGKLKEQKSGCKKPGGGCYSEGEEFTESCSDKTCMGGEIVTTKGGCEVGKKQCIAEDTVQVDKKKCTIMVCRKVGKEYKMMPGGAKCVHPDSGECVPIGEDFVDKSTCHQMVCEEKGKGAALRVAKKGCRDNEGKCMKNHETSNSECETLVCTDGELKATKIGCKKKDGGCYKEGDTYTEDCIKMKCVEGENKVIQGGCASKNSGDKTCLMEDEKVTEKTTCKEVQCVKDGDEFILKHINSDCLTDFGVCIKKHHSLTDHRTCKVMECVPKGKIDAKFQEAGTGCKDDDGKCIPHNTSKNAACNLYTCINGEMKITKAGCKKADGTCVADGEQFQEKHKKCTEFICKNGKNEIVEQKCINAMHGGKCYKVGEEFYNKNDCNTYQCSKKDYKMVPVKEACRTKDGHCVSDSESWEDKRECKGYSCERVKGVLQMVLIRADCISVYDKCYPAGSKTQFTCEVGGYEYHRCDCLLGPKPYPEIGKKKPYPGHPHTIAREGPTKQEGVCTFPFHWGHRKFGSCTMRSWPRLWCGTEVPFATRQWGQCLPEPEVKSTTGKMCHFPFKWEGKWQHECVRQNTSKTTWCSLTEDYDKDKEKADCIETPHVTNAYKPINNTLTYVGQCVIPFKYNGKIQYDCVRKTWDRPWCSLDYDYDKKKRWGFCVTWKMWRVWYDYRV